MYPALLTKLSVQAQSYEKIDVQEVDVYVRYSLLFTHYSQTKETW